MPCQPPPAPPIHWTLLIVSVLVPILTIVGVTMRRWLDWRGYVVSLINQPLVLFTTWPSIKAGAWGVLGLSIFWTGDAIFGLRQWQAVDSRYPPWIRYLWSKIYSMKGGDTR